MIELATTTNQICFNYHLVGLETAIRRDSHESRDGRYMTAEDRLTKGSSDVEPRKERRPLLTSVGHTGKTT